MARRRPIRDEHAEVIAQARAVARARARTESRLDQLTLERLAVVRALRAVEPPLSYLEIAELLGVTKARAQQLVAQALAPDGNQ